MLDIILNGHDLLSTLLVSFFSFEVFFFLLGYSSGFFLPVQPLFFLWLLAESLPWFFLGVLDSRSGDLVGMLSCALLGLRLIWDPHLGVIHPFCRECLGMSVGENGTVGVD